jgi:voltage-gated potassium channel
MIETTQSSRKNGTDVDAADPTGRLRQYMSKTQTALDVLALLTLWIVVVPPADLIPTHPNDALAFRVTLSVIYGIDMTIRARLATHHWRYLRTHPVDVVAVIVPPVRVIFSLRLVTSMFRRGNLARFLETASILVLNLALIVYFYERNAAGSNIHTFGQSMWWAVTTVSTVGYGDYSPVTVPGRIAATCIMAIAILVIAVVTAQVSSAFVEQATRHHAEPSTPDPDDPKEPSLADLDRRLARIEAFLSRATNGGIQPG